MRSASWPRASRVSLDTDRDDVLDTNTAVAAAGQPAARKHLVREESVDELAGDTQNLFAASAGLTSSSVRSTTTRSR